MSCAAQRVTFDLAVSDFARIDDQLVTLKVTSTGADKAMANASPSGPGGPVGYVDMIDVRNKARTDVSDGEKRRTEAASRRTVAHEALVTCLEGLEEPKPTGVSFTARF